MKGASLDVKSVQVVNEHSHEARAARRELDQVGDGKEVFREEDGHLGLCEEEGRVEGGMKREARSLTSSQFYKNYNHTSGCRQRGRDATRSTYSELVSIQLSNRQTNITVNYRRSINDIRRDSLEA